MNLTHENQILFAKSSTCWKAVKMFIYLVLRYKSLQNRHSKIEIMINNVFLVL